jgi:hypothetical protein
MTMTTLPDLLRLTDPGLRELLATMPASTQLIGLGPDGTPVSADLDAEAPHVLVGTGSGGGTTTILRTITSQLLHHGAHALVLDQTRISHPWARDLPTVTYRADVAAHVALLPPTACCQAWTPSLTLDSEGPGRGDAAEDGRTPDLPCSDHLGRELCVLDQGFFVAP